MEKKGDRIGKSDREIAERSKRGYELRSVHAPAKAPRGAEQINAEKRNKTDIMWH